MKTQPKLPWSVIQAIDIARTLIASDTSKIQGVVKSMRWLKKWATAHTLSIKTFPSTNALLLETHPEAKRHFSFIAHIDVVPSHGWEAAFKPEIHNGFLVGRGAVDDKGPLAICLAVLADCQKMTDVNVSCLIVTDEEEANLEIGKVIEAKTYQPDVCIVVDGGTHTFFDIGQKGIIRLTAQITTAGGHSAFEEAKNSASLQMLKFIEALKEFGSQQTITKPFNPFFLNISQFTSDTVPYGLPSGASAHLELQFPMPQTSKMWLKELTRLGKQIPGLVVNIQFVCEPHLIDDHQVLSLIAKLPHVKMETVGGVNIAKDLALAGIACVGHCPVTTYMAHCNDEKIALSDFKRGVATYLQLINYFRQD